MPKTRVRSVNNNIGGIVNSKDDSGIPESYLAYGKNIIGRPLGAMASRPSATIDTLTSGLPTNYRILNSIDFITPDGTERVDVVEI